MVTPVVMRQLMCKLSIEEAKAAASADAVKIARDDVLANLVGAHLKNEDSDGDTISIYQVVQVDLDDAKIVCKGLTFALEHNTFCQRKVMVTNNVITLEDLNDLFTVIRDTEAKQKVRELCENWILDWVGLLPGGVPD